MDNVREDLEERNIQLSTAYEKKTKNREVWRNIVPGFFEYFPRNQCIKVHKKQHLL